MSAEYGLANRVEEDASCICAVDVCMIVHSHVSGCVGRCVCLDRGRAAAHSEVYVRTNPSSKEERPNGRPKKEEGRWGP